MYIIQMADWHIGSLTKSEPSEKDIMNQSISEIIERGSIPEGEKVLICLCGDIIDSDGLSGDEQTETKERYKTATKLLKNYKARLEDEGKYTVEIRCCVGNHDITHKEEFLQFVHQVIADDIYWDDFLNCYSYDMPDSNNKMIFVGSCYGGQYKIGKINYERLETELKKCDKKEKKILVLHHTMLSMFEDDQSPIRDAARLLSLIEHYNVAAVLHGHIHGRENLVVGRNQCKLFGTGALFSRNNPNVNSQFNILRYENGEIQQVQNWRFNADGGDSKWDIADLYKTEKDVTFTGNTFEKVYVELLDSLDNWEVLNNVRLEIKENYKTFCTDLQEYLKDDFLRIGKRKYNYFELGEMWEATEIPPQLYFNHGVFFKTEEDDGIDFLVKELKKKPTSNRIILPAYNMQKVIDSLEDKIYLPSLVSLQFGVVDGTLTVHMYFRALEASRFLKINICEIYYILTQLENKGIIFDRVDIVISAFKVQKRDKFNCFLKAEIDELDSVGICAKVMDGKIDEISELIQEKCDAMETITKMDGISNMYHSMEASNKSARGEDYPAEILDNLRNTLKTYEKLDKIHHMRSEITEEEKQYEEEICKLLGNTISALKTMRGK